MRYRPLRGWRLRLVEEVAPQLDLQLSGPSIASDDDAEAEQPRAFVPLPLGVGRNLHGVLFADRRLTIRHEHHVHRSIGPVPIHWTSAGSWLRRT